VYPVTPFYQSVQGLTAYPSVKKIPWKVDLAIIAVPGHVVPQIVEECGESGVSGIIIIASGFSEIGPQGKALEDEILRLKQVFNLRIIGPNSLGVIRPSTRLYAAFVNKVTKAGKVAFISQSGALCVSILDWSVQANVGFSSFVSVGSMIDVNFADLIDYFGSDPETSSIILFIESIKDTRGFMSAARRFAGSKPIIVVKAGKSSEGTQAALSHTGAVAGEDTIYDAAFRRVGIIRVEAIADLFSCSELLDMQPPVKGPNLAIITNAGGPGIMATDFLISKGGKLAQLSDQIISELKNVLPPYWSASNPIDICEDATVNVFRNVLDIRLKDQNMDGFLIIYSPMGIADPCETAKTLIEFSKKTDKPILTSLLGGEDVRDAREILRKNSIPSYQTPEQAISTYMYLYKYMRNKELLYETPELLTISPPENILYFQGVLEKAVREGRKILTEPESKEFLEAYGIPTAKTFVARTPREAVKLASKIGFPVVMKIVSSQISHKAEVDGVILNIKSETEVVRKFQELTARVKSKVPSVKIEGMSVQPMISDGYELMFGSKKDPQFGSIIMFGLGGSDFELFKDISIGFPPFTQTLAKRLIEQIKAYKFLLEGFRGRPPVNITLLEEALIKFSQLIVDFPQIKEIDVNPVSVNENRVIALDARIVVDPAETISGLKPYNHLIIKPYPKTLVTKRKMSDGREVLLRPIKPEDETLLIELFRTFSKKTIALRFFQNLREISHQTLAQYCNIDYDREITIVGEIIENNKPRIICKTSVVVGPDGENGELTVVVGDPWQNKGLGTMIFDYILEISRNMGIKSVFGEILIENVKMMRICRSKGFTLKKIDEKTYLATLNLKSS